MSLGSGCHRSIIKNFELYIIVNQCLNFRLKHWADNILCTWKFSILPSPATFVFWCMEKFIVNAVMVAISSMQSLTQDKLELYRVHTPRALQRRCQSISVVRELDDASSLLMTFTYIPVLCQVVRMSREHIVGSVHRRDQQNAVFATLVGLAKQFEAY